MTEDGKLIDVVPGIANDIEIAKYQAQTARIGDVHRIVQLGVKKLALEETRKLVETLVIPKVNETAKVATTALILQQALLHMKLLTVDDLKAAAAALEEAGVIQTVKEESQPTPS